MLRAVQAEDGSNALLVPVGWQNVEVCALFFVFYHLIFLSLEIGSRDNISPRSVLTLEEGSRLLSCQEKISSLDTF